MAKCCVRLMVPSCSFSTCSRTSPSSRAGFDAPALEHPQESSLGSRAFSGAFLLALAGHQVGPEKTTSAVASCAAALEDGDLFSEGVSR